MKQFIAAGVAIMLTASLYFSYQSAKTLKAINDRADRANVEYQFVVTDTLMTVYDGNQVVGTVKIEGQLDSLLVDYNQ